MKKIILPFILFIIITSCKTNKYLQETDFNQITWLANLKNDFENDTLGKHQIIHYKYNEKDVFLVNNCYQCPDGLIRVYDMDKNTICEFGGIVGNNTCPDFKQEAEKLNFIYNDVK